MPKADPVLVSPTESAIGSAKYCADCGLPVWSLGQNFQPSVLWEFLSNPLHLLTLYVSKTVLRCMVWLALVDNDGLEKRRRKSKEKKEIREQERETEPAASSIPDLSHVTRV